MALPRVSFVALTMALVVTGACKKEKVPTAMYSPVRKCEPRKVDHEPRCTPRRPANDDKVVEVTFGHPDTGGDQGRANVCPGLVVHTRFSPDVECVERVGSFDSVGMGNVSGRDEVYVDDAPVCLALAGDRLEIRRGAELVGSVHAPPGAASIPSFTAMRCR